MPSPACHPSTWLIKLLDGKFSVVLASTAWWIPRPWKPKVLLMFLPDWDWQVSVLQIYGSPSLILHHYQVLHLKVDSWHELVSAFRFTTDPKEPSFLTTRKILLMYWSGQGLAILIAPLPRSFCTSSSTRLWLLFVTMVTGWDFWC